MAAKVEVQKSSLFGKDLISVKGIGLPLIEELFASADEMPARLGRARAKQKELRTLRGHTVTVLFYQPSSRTASSFIAAGEKLGANVVAFNEMTQFSSAAKGESLRDTIQSFEQTTDPSAIVLRHPDNNSSRVAADHSNVPIINAGSGTAEHPTQALLDLYTIQSKLGTMNNLKIALVGDLLYGRTVKSLATLLSTVGINNQFSFVSADQLRFPQEYLETLPHDTSYEETDDLITAAQSADVVYMTRTQKEWFEREGKLDDYEALRDKFKMTREIAASMKKNAIIMHPLPRQEELRYGVDQDPRAAYFDQMRYGLYIRMALLQAIIRGK